MVNHSRGRDDRYPFVLLPAVLGKMRFVHNAIDELSRPRIADRALGFG